MLSGSGVSTPLFRPFQALISDPTNEFFPTSVLNRGAKSLLIWSFFPIKVAAFNLFLISLQAGCPDSALYTAQSLGTILLQSRDFHSKSGIISEALCILPYFPSSLFS